MRRPRLFCLPLIGSVSWFLCPPDSSLVLPVLGGGAKEPVLGTVASQRSCRDWQVDPRANFPGGVHVRESRRLCRAAISGSALRNIRVTARVPGVKASGRRACFPTAQAGFFPSSCLCGPTGLLRRNARRSSSAWLGGTGFPFSSYSLDFLRSEFPRSRRALP